MGEADVRVRTVWRGREESQESIYQLVSGCHDKSLGKGLEYPVSRW